MIKIDLDQIIQSKSEKLYRRLPKWLIRLFARIVHQKDINRILAKFPDLEGASFISAVLDEVGIQRSQRGIEALDPGRRYLFACNHPLGGLDGFVLAEAVHKHFGDVSLVVNDILMNVSPVSSLFVPVNKHGRQSANYARLIQQLYLSNKPVVYFPAGLCSRKIHGKITDLEWKKNFVIKSIESKRDVVPVFVSGRNSNLFYNIARVRKLLHIRFNIEMILLPHELFIQKNQLKITFGEPISYEKLASTKTPALWAKEIRNISYALETIEF